MNRKIRKVILVLLTVVFLTGAALMFRQVMGYRAAAQAQQDALALVKPTAPRPTETTAPATEPTATTQAPEIPPETTEAPAATQAPLEKEAEFLLELDLSPMQTVNEDVLGWIHITGGDISYPLLRSYDNQDYLYITWEKKYSSAGSVFLECKNNRDLQDFNTIIYGHHMANGSVFAPLVHYRDPEYLADHAYVYILTDNELRRYEIFSAYEAALDSHTYRLYYPDLATKLLALTHYTVSSQVETRIAPTLEDHILTLSTCVGNGTYDTRWVVQARLTGVFPR